MVDAVLLQQPTDRQAVAGENEYDGNTKISSGGGATYNSDTGGFHFFDSSCKSAASVYEKNAKKIVVNVYRSRST